MKSLICNLIFIFLFAGCTTDEISDTMRTYIDFDINDISVVIFDVPPITIDPSNIGLSQSINPNICSTSSTFIESDFEVNGIMEIFLWRFTDIQIEELSCDINSNNYPNLIPLGNEFKFLNTANDCNGNTGIAEVNTILFNIGDGVSSRSDFGCQPSDSFFEITSVKELDIDEEGIKTYYPIIMEARFKFVTFTSGNDLPDRKVSGKMKIIININA